MPELIDRLSLIDKLDQGQKIALDAKDFTSFYALVYFKAILQKEPEIHVNDNLAEQPTIEPGVRLIDANALKKDLSEFNYDMALRIVDAQPTIDPEVRRGRMIEGRYPNENKCSECGQKFRDDIGFIIQDGDGVFHYPKRCPKCGAYWNGKGSKANGCWTTCNDCANTSCSNRDEEEGKSDGTG